MSRTSVSTSELAYLLDASTRTVRSLAARGIVKSVGRARYDRDASVTAVVRHLKVLIGKRGAERAAAAATERLKLAKVAMLEARYEREASQLVVAAEARAAWAHIENVCRRLLMGLPAKIAAGVATPLTERDRQMIERLCRDSYEDAAIQEGYRIGCCPGGH